MLVNNNNEFEELFDVADANDWGNDWDITVATSTRVSGETVDASEHATGEVAGATSNFSVAAGVAHGERGWAVRSPDGATEWTASASDVTVLTANRWISLTRFKMQVPVTSERGEATFLFDAGSDYESCVITAYGPDLANIQVHTGAWLAGTYADQDGPFYIITLKDHDAVFQYVVVATAWTNDWYYMEIDRWGGDGHRDTYLRLWKDGDPRPSTPTLSALNSGLLLGGAPVLSVSGLATWTPQNTAPVTYVGAGSVAAGTGNITPGLPAGLQPGDLMYLTTQTANEAVTTPTGWTDLGYGQASGVAGAADSIRSATYRKVAVSGEVAPTLTDPGNHIIGRIFAWRNARVDDNGQWSITTGIDPSFSSSWGGGGAVTSEPNATIVLMLTHAIDSNSAQVSSWALSSSADFAEITDDATNQGVGGGIAMGYGTIATQGTGFGTVSGTMGSGSRRNLRLNQLYADLPYQPASSFVIEVSSILVSAKETQYQPYGRDLHVLSIRASFTDDRLYNHALVVATGDKDNIFYGEVRDDDPGSPTNIADIGDRVFKYESDLISTQAAADQAAMGVFLANCLISEDIDMENICVPMLEGNDVIAVQELNFSELNQTFRIQSCTIPLSSSRQRIKFGRVITL